MGFPGSADGKEPACQSVQETYETWVQFLGQENPLEYEMATHSSLLAWRNPWTEDLGELLSIELQRVKHN